MKDLPAGWAWATLGEIADLKGGLAKGKRRRNEDRLRSVPYLRVENVQRGYLNLDKMKLIEATEAEIEDLRLRIGDVLFNEGGDRDKLGRGWVWQGALPECIHQNHVFRARLRAPDIQPKFLSLYGNSEGASYFNDQGKQTTNLASINLTRLSEFPVPLPPGCEQCSIVAEIEKQFTHLESAIASLRRAKANISRMRTSVISSMLGWDAWQKAALSRLIERIEAGKNFRCEERPPNLDEFGVVKVSAVSWGRFDEDASKTCSGLERFEARHLIRSGDFLMSRANTVELVGACVIVGRVTRRVMLSDKILRLVLREIEPAWLLYALRSPQGRQQIEARATGNQESMRNISQESIRAIEIPLPSRSEQTVLLAGIERSLSVADAADAVLDADLRRAARLRQAILHRAFAGKLVPQDPNDEPASVLLDRIRAVRAQASARRAPCKREVHA